MGLGSELLGHVNGCVFSRKMDGFFGAPSDHDESLELSINGTFGWVLMIPAVDKATTTLID